MSDYLLQLNEIQREAVTAMQGPVMVIAGAGSGKTRVLTYRIAHMIQQGVDPFHILSLTFTNKAAAEMKARIAQILGGTEARNLWMGTFHSVFAKVLRIEGDKLGYPSNFTIYDTDDSKSLMRNIIKEHNLDDKLYNVNMVLNRISNSKSNLISWEEYQSQTEIVNEDKIVRRPLIGQLYEYYQKRLFKSASMDFDDLLYNINILLRDFPDVLVKYQEKFKYVLVDEYQDTNFSQYIILKKLAARHENISVVGDDSQSIYAFRGANIQNILSFQKDYPDCKTFKLEQNYRSTKNIVLAANSIIEKNNTRLPKELWTDNEEGSKIRIVKCLSDGEEGTMVANSIFETKMSNQQHNKDFAILYRTNAQSRAMEEALRKQNIPYRIYGGLSFYNRKEIKDLIAYFRLTANHNDEEALLRIINYPARGIGKTTLDRIVLAANENEVSVWSIITDFTKFNLDINNGTRAKMTDFATMIKSFASMLEHKNAFELASYIANNTGLLKDLLDDKTPEGINRSENIQELLNGISDFVDKAQSAEPDSPEANNTLVNFMQDIALLTNADIDDKSDNDKVSLMTIHAAKGLEFPNVYLVGLEENLFPSQMALNTRSELEEERRLFYVAMTRAEKKLTISFAITRFKWGNMISSEASRFIDEIEPEYLEFPESKGILDTKNMKEEHDQRNITSSETSYQPLRPKKLVKLSKAINNNEKIGGLADAVQVGMNIEHERFGKGKVINIEGQSADRKATVFFEGVGQKQLLLKFAKLKILD